jgi:hypothetical protein
MLKRNKKGGFKDIIGLWNGLLIVAFVLVMSFVIQSSLYSGMQELDVATANSIDVSQKFTDKYVWDDKAFLILYAVLIIVSIVAAYRTTENKMYYAVCFVLLLVTFMYGLLIEDIWASFVSNETISGYASQLTFMNYILSNPVIFVVFQLIVMLVVGYYRRVAGD